RYAFMAMMLWLICRPMVFHSSVTGPGEPSVARPWWHPLLAGNPLIGAPRRHLSSSTYLFYRVASPAADHRDLDREGRGGPAPGLPCVAARPGRRRPRL